MGRKTKSKSERIIFNGVTFYRYPDAKQWAHRSYFTPHVVNKRLGFNYLHIELWKSVHGAVPEGCHIHHKDGNPLNNDISNLECLTKEEHGRLHGLEWRTDPAKRAHLDRMVQLSIAAGRPWHKTEEARQFYQEQGVRNGLSQTMVDLVCQQCGKTFQSAHTDAKYCSQQCSYQVRKGIPVVPETGECRDCQSVFTKRSRRQVRCLTCSRGQSSYSPVEHTPKECRHCGAAFTPKNSRQYTCSPECGKRYLNNSRKTGLQLTSEERARILR